MSRFPDQFGGSETGGAQSPSELGNVPITETGITCDTPRLPSRMAPQEGLQFHAQIVRVDKFARKKTETLDGIDGFEDGQNLTESGKLGVLAGLPKGRYTPEMPRKKFKRINNTRHANLLLLCEEYAEKHGKAGALKGLAKRAHLDESYLSQLRSRIRSVGDVVAEHLERVCGKYPGWMDLPHGNFLPEKHDTDEAMFLAEMAEHFRMMPQKYRDAIIKVMKKRVHDPQNPWGGGEPQSPEALTSYTKYKKKPKSRKPATKKTSTKKASTKRASAKKVTSRVS